MKALSKKLQILESLDALDQSQTEKVLNYIQGLTDISRDDVRYQNLKREAIREIRQALSNGRKLYTAF